MLRRGALAASCVAPLPLGIRVREDVSCVPFVRMHLSVAFQHEFTAPLCRLHHRAVHLARNEAEWWSKLGLDAVATAISSLRMVASGEASVAVQEANLWKGKLRPITWKGAKGSFLAFLRRWSWLADRRAHSLSSPPASPAESQRRLCDMLADAARLHAVGRQDPGWVEDATL
jgi:hypothetical protein